MNEEQKEAIRARVVDDLKHASLQLASAAGEVFDQLDEHGLDAAFDPTGTAAVIRMATSYETLRAFFARQAAQRLVALGLRGPQ